MAAGLNTGFVARIFVHTSAFAIAIRSASLATLAEIFGDVGMTDSLYVVLLVLRKVSKGRPAVSIEICGRRRNGVGAALFDTPLTVINHGFDLKNSRAQ